MLWPKNDAAGSTAGLMYSMRILSESLSRIECLTVESKWLDGPERSSGSESQQHGFRSRDSCSKADSSSQRYMMTGIQTGQKPVFEVSGWLCGPVAMWTDSSLGYNNFGDAVDCIGCRQDRSGCRSGSCTGP